MRINLKVAIVGLVAAVLVGIGAFGFGSLGSQAAIQNTCPGNAGGAVTLGGQLCAFVVQEQGIDSTPTSGTTAPAPTCPFATGAVHIDAVNFPPIIGSTSPSTTPLVVSGVPSVIAFQNNALLSFPIVGNGSILICVNAANGDGALSFDSNDQGTFDRPSCGPGSTGNDGDSRVAEWPDDQCRDPFGVTTDHLVIPDNSNGLDNDLQTVIVRYNCGSFVGTTRIMITQGNNTTRFVSFDVTCRGEVTALTITATPNTVEIVPARGNTAHSLIDVDSGTTATIIGRDVDFRTDRCAIEESNINSASEYINAKSALNLLNSALPGSYAHWEWVASTYLNADIVDGVVVASGSPVVIDSPATISGGNPQVDTTLGFDVNNITGINPTGSRTHAAAILHCDPHGGVATATPGVATVSVCWTVADIISATNILSSVLGTDICGSVTVTVIGPPASITVAASPTSLRCGEKATITATVKDAIGQNVSDHTRVELVTNLGGTIGGQGAVASFAGPVVPISSSVGDTFGGVSTAFLITSEVTSGPYEVVATSGGTSSGDFTYGISDLTASELSWYNGLGYGGTYLGGIFSTPPVSAQVTVTCTIPAAVVAPAAPAPTITAPRTGQGITPPNTGDAGLASSSSNSWTFVAFGAVIALGLAGFATVKAARR